jgi:LPS sulfotransferase NodH
MTDNKCVANHKSSSWVMPAVGRLPPAASCLVYFQQEYNKSDMLQNRPSMPDTQLICGFLFFFLSSKNTDRSAYGDRIMQAQVLLQSLSFPQPVHA